MFFCSISGNPSAEYKSDSCCSPNFNMGKDLKRIFMRHPHGIVGSVLGVWEDGICFLCIFLFGCCCFFVVVFLWVFLGFLLVG